MNAQLSKSRFCKVFSLVSCTDKLNGAAHRRDSGEAIFFNVIFNEMDVILNGVCIIEECFRLPFATC